MRFSSGGRPLDLTPEDVTWESMQPACARAGETLTRAVSILPALSDIPINTIWGGLIDLTPDGIPVIDRIPEVDGLTIAAGYSGHGFCLGPVSGEIIRTLVTGAPGTYPLDPFRWGRFAGEGCDSRAELLG
jgi:sarcosine oxidase, subunit beta